MAERNKTTSSKSFDSGQRKPLTSPAMPNAREVELMTHLADNINASYKMVKQRQQKLYDLTNPRNLNSSSEESSAGWQDVTSNNKNKLKRKKTLSSSLTSVNDSVNQEKRTRIEGIQLNCRGKLNIKENLPEHNVPNQQVLKQIKERSEKLASKPPLPPQSIKAANSENNPPKTAGNPPPPRLKRKLQENVQTIQKLNALTEQLRLEINELKSNLTTEKGAVRVLRAQNEAESRKWKNEVKKLQNCVEFLKKTGANKKSESAPSNADNTNLPHQAAVGGLVNYEIQRLTNEINALKEANKALEEKKVINCDADRRKAADIRELKDSYEIRLTQIQKSAKTEISRLLEEIKTKERNIGQLKKDLQTIQNSKKHSRNATTNPNSNSNTTNKTTTLNSNKKPKNSNNNNNNSNSNSNNSINNISNNNDKQNAKAKAETIVNAICCCNCNGIIMQTSSQTVEPSQLFNNKMDNTDKEMTCPDDDNSNNNVSKANEISNEISKLKNIELITNTRNVTTNLQRTTKILTTRNENEALTLNPVHQQLKALEIPDEHSKGISSKHKNADEQPQILYTTLLTTTHLAKISAPVIASSVASAKVQQSVVPASAPCEIDATNCGEMSPMTSVTPPAATIAPTTCDVTDHYEEQNLNQELAQHLNNTQAIQDAKQADLRHHNHNHSDSDSALSSAPPSISPQPPANGVEPTDIWQTIRSYTNDIEKLQKEVESLHTENEKLQQELNAAKDQIVDLENAAVKNNNSEKHQQLLERIKYLEEQEHQLEAEANELREQNELLEFRILELEDTTDKWSLHSASNPTEDDATTSHSDKNVWSCPSDISPANKTNPFDLLFRSNSHRSTTSSVQPDSGIISPQSQGLSDDLIDLSHDELCRQLGDLLKKSSLQDEEKQCLQHVLHLVQQLEALTPRSAPDSLNALQTSDENNSLEMFKPHNTEYCTSSTASPLSSNRCSYEKTNVSKSSSAPSSTPLTSGRIVATVQPYNSTPSSSLSSHIVPHNSPTDSPRKSRPSTHHWQNNSLSESGVFLESDFLSDSGEINACTQTDFEENLSSPNHSLTLSSAHVRNVPAPFNHLHQPQSLNLTDQKRLQFYKDRLEVLEGKIQIYESSGDTQAKRLAERLQREILLEKEVKELRDRVEVLESENALLEEEKCEFEEAENDTRLRLQRLEVELEILSQRNVELDMSREALSAKYKDCHSECLILRDDLATSETHIRHLEEDKQKAKENFEFLHNILPLLLLFNTVWTISESQGTRPVTHYSTEKVKEDMGNQNSTAISPIHSTACIQGGGPNDIATCNTTETFSGQERETQYLKDEVKCLRHQIKELNIRHYAAMESADSHWVDLEKEYKEREEQFRTKEMCLKLKIQKMQDCLREDSRSASEKICQLEEQEQGLKTCLVKVSKEHQKLLDDHQCLVSEFERFKELHDQLKEQQKPLADALESEKKRNKSLMDELTFMSKLQNETEIHSKSEIESVRTQMFDLKKEYLHIEVTNAELREEVATIEKHVETLQQTCREFEEKVCCLTDEIRTKDEICQKLEKRLERSEGYSLADELGDTPSKRFKREDVKDLESASRGLGNALKHVDDCETLLPTQQQFQSVARDVKKLADTLLHSDVDVEEVSMGPLAEETNKTYGEKTEDTNKTYGEKTEDTNTTNHEIKREHSQSSDINFDRPLAASTPVRGNSITDDAGQNVIVGMALVSQMFLGEQLLPSCSQEQKKVICEVPSELRKLSKQPEQEAPLKVVQPTEMLLKVNPTSALARRKRGKRCVKRRLTRGRINTMHTRVRHIISKMNASRHFADVSDLDLCESEVLQRNISYISFQSIKDDTTESLQKKIQNEEKSFDMKDESGCNLSLSSFQSIKDDIECLPPITRVDAFTEYELIEEMHDIKNEPFIEQYGSNLSLSSFHSLKEDFECFPPTTSDDAFTEYEAGLEQMHDIGVETVVEKCDSSVQVEEDLQCDEILLPNAPAHILCFLAMLRTAVTNNKFDVGEFNKKLSKHWQCDDQFLDGLELLANLTGFRSDYIQTNTESLLNSYENFVKALSDIHILQELFKPFKNPMLKQIEEQVNEHLMNFHNRKMESEFYCTVYYPVNRPKSIEDCRNFL